MATNPLVAHYISSYIADVFPDIVAPSAPTPSPFDEEEADRRFGKFPISRPQTATTAGTTSQETGDKDFSPTTTGTGASVGTYSYAGTPGSLDPFSPLAQQISAYSSASIFNPSSYPELIAKNIFGLTPTYDPITGLVSVTPPNVGLLGAPGIGAVANLVSGYMQGKFQEAAKLAAAGVPGSGLATLNGQTVAMINGKLYGNIPTGMSYQDAVSAVEDYFDKASLVQTYQEEGFVGDVDTGYHPDVVLDNVQDKLAYAYSEYGRVPEGGYAGSGFSTSSPDPSSGVSEYSEAGRPPATGSSSGSSSSSTAGSSPASEGPPGGNGGGDPAGGGSGPGSGMGGQMGGPRAFGGSVGYAMGGMSGGNSFSGFVEGPPQNYSNGATVADTVNTQVREGSFIINAPATEELQSLGMLPQNKVAKLAKGGKMVDVALSKGEYIVDKDDVDNYGGYSFLEAVNDKGRSEVDRRQKAAEGGFINGYADSDVVSDVGEEIPYDTSISLPKSTEKKFKAFLKSKKDRASVEKLIDVLTDTERLAVLGLVETTASTDPVESMMAVGQVAMNRAASNRPDFKDVNDLASVMKQRSYRGSGSRMFQYDGLEPTNLKKRLTEIVEGRAPDAVSKMFTAAETLTSPEYEFDPIFPSDVMFYTAPDAPLAKEFENNPLMQYFTTLSGHDYYSLMAAPELP